MPNYCSNTLVLKASTKEDLITFYKENYESEPQSLSFNQAIPVPIMTSTVTDYYNAWGTKWEPSDIEVYEDFDMLDESEDLPRFGYVFYTAWSPPLPWLAHVAQRYPQIHFELEYSEPGCDVWGKIQYKNGQCILSLEKALSEYNWEHADKDTLGKIVDSYRDQLQQHPEYADDIVDSIVEEFRDKDSYNENIEDYIRELAGISS